MIAEAAFFVPFEAHNLIGGFSVAVLVILMINVFIVWYLFANRHRHFRHQHHVGKSGGATRES